MPVFEFAGFQLDSVKRHLISHGKVVTLAPRAIDVLGALLARSGETVDKDEMMRVAWGTTVVEENTLARNILLIRKALGETPDNKFILTVAGRGYRFVCPVTVRTQPESPPVPGNSRRRIAAAAAAAGLILIAGAGYAYRQRATRGLDHPFAAGESEHATRNGGVLKVALSPDGRTLTFVAQSASLRGLYTRDLVTGEEREIMEPGGFLIFGLTPSVDGSSVYFVARRGDEITGTLYRVALSSGDVNASWRAATVFGGGKAVNQPDRLNFAPDSRRGYGQRKDRLRARFAVHPLPILATPVQRPPRPIRQIGDENAIQPRAMLRVLHRRQHLHPPSQIARTQVR